MKPNSLPLLLKLLILGILLLFSSTIYAQSDTLFIEFNNGTYKDYKISSIFELTFSSESTDSIYVSDSDKNVNSYTLNELSEISFNNGNPGGTSVNISDSKHLISKPEIFSIKQNYPNPFNPTTQIAYSLTQKGEVTLRVVDMTGKVIKELYKGVQESGDHLQTWNGYNSTGRMSSSGLYMILIEFNGTQLSKKMTLIK